MTEVVKELVSALAKGNPASVISRALFQFRMSVNPKIFQRLPVDSRKRDFERVFGALLKCCENDSSSVRMAAYSATYAFLAKTVRFYPGEMQKTFEALVQKHGKYSKGSVILIASFAYMTNFIAKAHLGDFVNSVPIFHHFVQSDSEYLPNIIANLGDLDHPWYNTLLNAFIKQYLQTKNNQLFVPILKIVEKKPKVFFLEVLNATKDPSLISFLISSLDKMYYKFDLSSVAITALERLKTAEFSERDDCLQIVSIKSNSFELKVDVSGNEAKLSIGEHCTVLNIDEFKDVASFYLLPLPVEMLILKDDDPFSIVQSKFRSISRMCSSPDTIMDVEPVIDLIDKFSQRDYDEFVANCLKCLSKSLDCLIANADSLKLVRILKRIIHTECRSWIHADRVLDVIIAAKGRLLKYIPLMERIEVLVKFISNSNDKFALRAMSVIADLAKGSDFARITSFVAQSIDLFDDLSVQRHLQCLGIIISENEGSSRRHLRYLVAIINELSLEDNLVTLGAVCQFLQHFRVDETKCKYISCAKAVVFSSQQYFVGINGASKVDSGYEGYVQAVEDYISSKNVEIVSEGCHMLSRNYALLVNAFSFLVAQDIDARTINYLFGSLFEYYPVVCAARLAKLNDSNLMTKLFPALATIDSSKVFRVFCKNAAPKFRNELAELVKYYLMRPEKVPLEHLFQFCLFLSGFETKYEALITVFIYELPVSMAMEFLTMALSDVGFAARYSPQLNTLSAKLPNPQKLSNFDSMSEEEKRAIIFRFLGKDPTEELPEAAVQYGLTILSGWSLEKFKWKCKQPSRYMEKAFNGKDFSDELDTQINICLETDNTSRLMSLLNFCAIKRKTVDFGSKVLSETTMPIVLDYLWTRKKPLPPCNPNSEVSIIYAIASNPHAFVDQMISSPKVKKRDILHLLKASEMFEENPTVMFPFITRLLNETERPDRLTFVFLLTAEVLQKSGAVPDSFVQFLFEFLKQRTDTLPVREVGVCLAALASRVTFSEEQCQFLRTFSGLCGFTSTELSFLLSTIIATVGNSEASFAKISEIPIQFLDGERPSQLIGGIRIMKQCLFSMPKEHLLTTMEPSLGKMLLQLQRQKLNPGVNMIAVEFIRHVMMMDLPPFHKEISAQLRDLLYSSNMFVFLDYLAVLTPAMISIPSQELTDICYDILSHPWNVRLFSVFVEMFEVKLADFSTGQERQARLLQIVEQFSKLLATFDCYEIQTYFILLLRLVRKTLGVKMTLELIVSKIISSSQRFFPAFFVFAREFKSIKTDYLEEGQQAIAHAMVLQKSDTHICAFEMLMREASFHEALDIALLETD